MRFRIEKERIIFSLIVCILILLKSITGFGAQQFPIRVMVITRDLAKYDTPENAYVASYSSEIKEDLDWTFETMTIEAVDELKTIFHGLNIPLEEIVKYKKTKEETYIVHKSFYSNACILTVDHYYEEGSIQRTPVSFVLENGKWKLTNRFANDDNVNQYTAYYKRFPMGTRTTVTYSGVRFDRRTGQFSSSVRVSNVSGKELQGPVWLKITSLQPAGAELVNADGMHFDEPYLIMLGEEEKWLPDQALPSKTLYFNNPSRQRITFDSQVFAVESEEGS